MKVIYKGEERTVDKIDFTDGTLRVVLGGSKYVWVEPEEITSLNINIVY